MAIPTEAVWLGAIALATMAGVNVIGFLFDPWKEIADKDLQRRLVEAQEESLRARKEQDAKYEEERGERFQLENTMVQAQKLMAESLSGKKLAAMSDAEIISIVRANVPQADEPTEEA